MTSYVIALVVTFGATGLVVPLLRHAQVMDVPNARSSHRGPVPRGGGLGVLVGLTVGVAMGSFQRSLVGILAVTVLAGVLGFADDLFGLSVTRRLGIQLLLGAVLSVWLVNLYFDGPLLVIGAVTLATVWLVGYLNAFNFMDGINGISALSAAVAGGWYAWLGHDLAVPGLSTAGFALGGASLGFLPWNAPRARVFLGDVGSYGLGTFIASLGLLALLEGADPVLAVAPLVVYIADTAWALTKRLRRGDSWREAHREHVYQLLSDAGWGHLEVAVLLAGLAAVACAFGATLPLPLAVTGIGLLVLAYLSAASLAEACPRTREET